MLWRPCRCQNNFIFFIWREYQEIRHLIHCHVTGPRRNLGGQWWHTTWAAPVPVPVQKNPPIIGAWRGSSNSSRQAGSSSKFPRQSTSETGQIDSEQRQKSNQASFTHVALRVGHISRSKFLLAPAPRVNEASLSASLPPVSPRWFC